MLMTYSFDLCTPLKKNDMLDIHNLMSDLSQHRPIFHSEADFQFALAWRIHEVMSDCEIRLEFKPYPSVNMYLDIWIQTAEIAIELKFPTQNLEAKRDNEHFALRAQGAQDRTPILNLYIIPNILAIGGKLISLNEGNEAPCHITDNSETRFPCPAIWD